MVDMIGCRHPVVNHDTENAETFDGVLLSCMIVLYARNHPIRLFAGNFYVKCGRTIVDLPSKMKLFTKICIYCFPWMVYANNLVILITFRILLSYIFMSNVPSSKARWDYPIFTFCTIWWTLPWQPTWRKQVHAVLVDTERLVVK